MQSTDLPTTPREQTDGWTGAVRGPSHELRAVNWDGRITGSLEGGGHSSVRSFPTTPTTTHYYYCCFYARHRHQRQRPQPRTHDGSPPLRQRQEALAVTHGIPVVGGARQGPAVLPGAVADTGDAGAGGGALVGGAVAGERRGAAVADGARGPGAADVLGRRARRRNRESRCGGRARHGAEKAQDCRCHQGSAPRLLVPEIRC